MSRVAFTIKNLFCSYTGSKEKAVLSIPELQLETGKIYFVLGSSGSGKSTFVEALGLMNNTVAEGDITFHLSSPDISYAQLWNGTNKERQQVRRQYFSFIFQQTNLLENFTAVENASISRMIKLDENFSEAKGNVSAKIRKVGLHNRILSTDPLPRHLSGGQRQRLSFIRALDSPFSVLFCDEPTGNLDAQNAHSLFEIIRQNIDDTKLAIIVSHDVDLALAYADEIICLTKPDGQPIPVITAENTIKRDTWVMADGSKTAEAKQRILSLFDNGVAKEEPKSEEISISTKNPKSTVTSLFFRNEGKELIGKRWANLLILVVLFTLTLVSLGIGQGTLDYLNVKLSDPFVNWVSVKIPQTRSRDSEVQALKLELNQQSLRDRFYLKMTTSFTEQPLKIVDKNTGEYLPVRGRTMQMGTEPDPLITDIVGKKNLVAGSGEGFTGERDLSIIVTAMFLKKHKYPADAVTVDMYLPIYGGENDTNPNDNFVLAPVNIRAIVKEIPGKNDLLFTPYFLHAYRQNVGCTFDVSLRDDVRFLVKGSPEEANKVAEAIKKVVEKSPYIQQFSPDQNKPAANDDSYRESYVISFSFLPSLESPAVADSVVKVILSDPLLAAYNDKVSRHYNFYDFKPSFVDNLGQDQLSIIFSSLDYIREFATYFLINFNSQDPDSKDMSLMEIDTAKVKEKENFAFMANLTYGIVAIIILIAATSISLFLANMFKFHLNKQRVNIGTLLALGLSARQLVIIYTSLLAAFVAAATVLGCLAALVAGSVVNYALGASLKLEEGFAYFSLWHTNILIALVIITAISFLYATFIVRSMLLKTPGDLIYDR